MTPTTPAREIPAPELRATARVTATRELRSAIAALEAAAELRPVDGREGTAIDDAVTLARAAIARLADADRHARIRTLADTQRDTHRERRRAARSGIPSV